MDILQMRQSADVELVRGKPEILPIKGKFHIEHLRAGEVIGDYDVPNTITTEGKLFLLDTMFHGTAAITTWYVGLVDNTGYSAFATGDTYDNINQPGNGWDEFTTYTVSANATIRATWDEGAAYGAGNITSSTTAVFDITANGTVKGIFVCGGANAQTKSDDTATGNKLWSAAPFSSGNVTVLNADQLKVTYTVSC